jgi:hypothetical protein
VSRTVIAKRYRSQPDRLRAIAVGRVGVEHFGGPRVRKHFPIGRLMPLIEKTSAEVRHFDLGGGDPVMLDSF